MCVYVCKYVCVCVCVSMYIYTHTVRTKKNVTVWQTNSLPWKMAIQFVDSPIENGEFPLRYVTLPKFTQGYVQNMRLFSFSQPKL